MLVPAADRLPSNAAYLAHLNVAAEGARLVRLASNENTLPPSPRVREALLRAYDDANLYPAPLNPLRQALAARHGVEVQALAVGAGATEVIDAALRTFVRAGDEVVLATPSWAVYWRRLEALEARLTEAPMRVDEHSYHYAIDDMLAAVTARTKVVVLCTPNNPTGNVAAEADARRLAETGCVVLLDQAYCDFAPGADLGRLAGEYDNVLAAYTFSKAHCLAGLRLGYMIGAPQVMDYVDRFLVPGSSVSSAALHAGLAALEDEAFHRGQIERIIAERQRLIGVARGLGLRAFDSGGNFFAVDAAQYPGGPAGFAAAVLAHGVVIRVMSGLLRITVGTPDENDALAAALERVVHAWPKGD